MFVFLLRFKIILLIFLFNVLLFSFSLSAQQPKQSNDLRTLCDTFFKKHEIRSGIPPYLLKAISLKETGRWDNNKKETFAWPWTVTSGKGSHYFKYKQSAIRAGKRLQLRNIKNIDVGCMQINLKYHPKAFNSLEQAFDPNSNISYAALFLKKLLIILVLNKCKCNFLLITTFIWLQFLPKTYMVELNGEIGAVVSGVGVMKRNGD